MFTIYLGVMVRCVPISGRNDGVAPIASSTFQKRFYYPRYFGSSPSLAFTLLNRYSNTFGNMLDKYIGSIYGLLRLVFYDVNISVRNGNDDIIYSYKPRHRITLTSYSVRL